MTDPKPVLGATGLLIQSVRIFLANFAIFFPIAFAPLLLVQALLLLISILPVSNTGMAEMFEFLGMLASTVISYVIAAVISLTAVDYLTGQSRGLSEYFNFATGRLVPLVVSGVIVSFAVTIATLAFIIPGIYVAAQFFVVVQCILFENVGLGGLRRSQTLTRGYRWNIVRSLLLVILILVTVVIAASYLAPDSQTVVDGLDVEAPQENQLSLFGVFGIAALLAVVSAVGAIFSTLIYVRLREIKDSVTIREIASVRA